MGEDTQHNAAINGLGNDYTPCLPLDCWPQSAVGGGQPRQAQGSTQPPYLLIVYSAISVSSPAAPARQRPRPEKHRVHLR